MPDATDIEQLLAMQQSGGWALFKGRVEDMLQQAKDELLTCQPDQLYYCQAWAQALTRVLEVPNILRQEFRNASKE